MNRKDYPIVEFDPDPDAIINPSHSRTIKGAPEVCIFPFYKQVIDDLADRGILKEIAREHSLVTNPLPLYEFIHEGNRIALMVPGLGAPFAAGNLEFAIANGCKKILAIGSCGVLDPAFPRNHLILPSSAIRDEGTSYHYLPATREVVHDGAMFSKLRDFLNARQVKFTVGKTWTTDAFYRETKARIKRRREEGAVAVDMEAAALMAVARFRGVELGYLLASGDDISGLEWDPRVSINGAAFHEKFFWLAADFCSALSKGDNRFAPS